MVRTSSPKEVEDCLVGHDAVADAAAIGVDDDDYGKRLRAFVVVRDQQTVSEDDLREHVKANLAGFKVPRDVVFLDELPRNATGKVLKAELAERQEGDGDPGRGDRRRLTTPRVEDWAHHDRSLSAALRPTSGCVTSSDRTYRCPPTAAPRPSRCCSSRTPSRGSAPARWWASATGSPSS